MSICNPLFHLLREQDTVPKHINRRGNCSYHFLEKMIGNC
jgi:hypothetical protein